jgi:putative membrane protein
MKSLTTLLLCAALGGMPLATSAVAQDANSSAGMKVDKAAFVEMATSSNMLEIQSSEVALQRGSSEEVKEFANQMINDHTKASNEMADILQKKNMAPPQKMAAEHAKMLKELTDTQTNFDAAYVRLQRAAHEEAVGLFTSYSSNPDDPDLGAFAQKTLPTLQMHLDHATKLGE